MSLTHDGNTERLRRWRLILGGGEADGICGAGGEAMSTLLGASGLSMDKALAALYDGTQERRGGLEKSAPNVARWLGDIREYFPSAVVRVMQQDALERLNLHQMLLEPEKLAAVEADVHLVANLMSLNRVIPERTKETARLDPPQRALDSADLMALARSMDLVGKAVETDKSWELQDLSLWPESELLAEQGPGGPSRPKIILAPVRRGQNEPEGIFLGWKTEF